MHVLSTIGLLVCIIGLSLMLVSVAAYIEDRCDNFFVRMLSMTTLIVAVLPICYGLSVLMALE